MQFYWWFCFDFYRQRGNGATSKSIGVSKRLSIAIALAALRPGQHHVQRQRDCSFFGGVWQLDQNHAQVWLVKKRTCFIGSKWLVVLQRAGRFLGGRETVSSGDKERHENHSNDGCQVGAAHRVWWRGVASDRYRNFTIESYRSGWLLSIRKALGSVLPLVSTRFRSIVVSWCEIFLRI